MTVTHHDFDLCLEKRAPHEFTAYVPDEAGGRATEHHFGLRLDTLKMREDLRRLEAYALHGELVRDDFHVQFGRMLYGLALGGEVGALFAAQLAAAQADHAGLRLRVRVDEEAPELMNVPWEFLHDGENFLVTRWETPLSRLPLGVAHRTVQPLTRALRLLVVVSSPVNLPDHQVLNTEQEQEVILAALDKLQRERVVEVDFCEDATLDTIQDYLSEQEYDVLHFTGHGVYSEERGQGYLLLEDEQGNMAEVANTDVADLLRNVGRSLRLVALSACQSARTSNNDAYADLARRLMRQGVSAVLSMQYAVLDRAATDFAGRFYTALAHNKPVDVALTEGRFRLTTSAAGEDGGQHVDFATPVLFLNDPACVTVEAIRPVAEELALDKPLDFGTVSVMEKNFVGRQREMRRIRQGFTRERKRAFIIHGLGGIGKSVLATRVATKLARHFHGVKAIKATPTLRPEDVLSELNAFLNLAGINQFNPVIHAPMRLADKTAVMAQILSQVPFLVIFDNFEDVLVRGREVKREGVKREGVKRDSDEIVDPALAGFFEQLLQGVAKETKLLFTSRYDFDPLGGRLTGEVGHIPLGEMPFPMAVQHMNNHDALAPLPVVPPQRARLPAPVPPITKRELYRKLGGHPYAIDVFARRAAVTTVADALLEIADVEREMIEFTLLDRTYAQLPPRAQTLLMRASVYEEDVPLDGLQWMLGDEREAMPAVDSELRALLGWGMLARKEVGDEVVYPMHALVRDYARRRRAESAEDERVLLLRAAKFWELQGWQTDDLWDLVKAREYYYRAGEHRTANELFRGVIYHYLERWGHVELLIRLLNQTIATAEGTEKAQDLGQLASIYQGVGDYITALKLYNEVKTLFESAGDKRRIAVVLHQLGITYQLQGNYAEAQANYEQSLAMSAELGAKLEMAASLHQLGTIHEAQGNYAEAQASYEQNLAMVMELGDKRGMAASLHQLGMIHQAQGNYAEAQARCEQSLAIEMELGNKLGIAQSLHQLGTIHEAQGNYAEAQARYEQSLAIAIELGDKRGMAASLSQLGVIHQLQGDYQEAQQKQEQSLAIGMEIGDKKGIAVYLHQLGMIHQAQGNYPEAQARYEQSLAIAIELGAKLEMATSLHQLGNIHYLQGNYAEAQARYEQNLVTFAELGAKLEMAGSLHQLGTIHQAQGNFAEAQARYEQSLAMFGELGAKREMASVLNNLGRIHEEQGSYTEAFEKYVQALIMFEQLGSPDARMARGNLARLRGKMGEKAWGEVQRTLGLNGLDNGLGKAAGEESAEAGMTLVQAVELVVQNTVAEMTEMPEEREELWEALGQLQAQARQHGDTEFAAFLGVVQEMVEGADPAGLEQAVPTTFREAWKEIQRALGSSGQ